MAAALAVYFALFVKHTLAGGERGMVLVLAMSMDQAKVVFDYTLAFIQNSPALRNEIESTTRSEIRLKNGIIIAIHSNSFRSVRGRTLCAARTVRRLELAAGFRYRTSAMRAVFEQMQPPLFIGLQRQTLLVL